MEVRLNRERQTETERVERWNIHSTSITTTTTELHPSVLMKLISIGGGFSYVIANQHGRLMSKVTHQVSYVSIDIADINTTARVYISNCW